MTAEAPIPTLSVLGQKWILPDEDGLTYRMGAALSQSTGLPAVVACILAGRGFAESTLATNFLSPRLESLPNPSTLAGMQVAVERIAKAIIGKEVIAIFGDYDVDGTCATALLTRYFRQLGIKPLLYIPDRLTEGYGPTEGAMEKLKAQGTDLLITVDTGTTAHGPLKRAHELGLDVIVTDHHQPDGPLPPAVAVLNPHRADDISDLKELCGSGVAFYLLMGLNRYLREQRFFQNIPEPRLAALMDLVALATVADVMKLVGVNRVLVHRGLQQLATWQHRGLAALAGVAGVKDDVSATSLGFSLAPRLNAAGRIDSAKAALNLLLAERDEDALPLAENLNDLNQKRQGMEKEILAAARRQAEALMTDDMLALVLHDDSWHPGIVGIVAARIKEQFNRPTFILGTDSNGHLKGSGRSISGLNIGAAVHAAAGTLLSGGGHAMAAGVTLERQNLAAFRLALQSALGEQLVRRTEDAHLPLAYRLAPKLTIDAKTTPSSLSAVLCQSLQQLAPFGPGNPEPVLALEGARITYCKPVGATQEHLKLRIGDMHGANLDAVCFGAMNSALGPMLANSGGRAITLAVTAKPRMFNGKVMMDVHVKDAWDPLAT